MVIFMSRKLFLFVKKIFNKKKVTLKVVKDKSVAV